MSRDATFRFGAAVLLTLVLVLFLIAAPNANWAKAVALALEGAVVIVVAVTSTGNLPVSQRRALVAGGAMVLLVVLVAVGIVPVAVVESFAGVLAVALFAILLRGVARLIEGQGVTAQAVAGALTIYLLIGVVFAWTIGVVSQVSNTPYFVQHQKPTTSQIVYFSFTTLTTTGYGDFTAATSFGRALAVLEMMFGQLYLVTVIGVLVGNYAGRRRRQS